RWEGTVEKSLTALRAAELTAGRSRETAWISEQHRVDVDLVHLGYSPSDRLGDFVEHEIVVRTPNLNRDHQPLAVVHLDSERHAPVRLDLAPRMLHPGF